MSVGFGLFFVPVSTVGLSGVAPHDAGVASAMLNTTQQVGGALGPALLTTLYVSALAGYLASNRPGPAGARALQLDGFLHGYRIAFIMGGCLFALALLVTIFLVDAKKDDAPSGQDASAGPDAIPTEARPASQDR